MKFVEHNEMTRLDKEKVSLNPGYIRSNISSSVFRLFIYLIFAFLLAQHRAGTHESTRMSSFFNFKNHKGRFKMVGSEELEVFV